MNSVFRIRNHLAIIFVSIVLLILYIGNMDRTTTNFIIVFYFMKLISYEVLIFLFILLYRILLAFFNIITNDDNNG